jgi:hypothetical protein
MTIKYHDNIRSTRASLWDDNSMIGASAVLHIRTGAPPANCAAANSGTLLAAITLPANWISGSSGVASKVGTWTDASADNSGTAGHFRIFEATATTCHIQGTVGTSGTDMIVDSVTFTAGQSFSVLTFTLTEGNP